MFIEVGGDPDLFWRRTPRQCLAEINARRDGVINAQIRMAEAVWVGSNASASELEKYAAKLRGEDALLPVEALPGLIRESAAGLPTITREEYFASKG